MPYGQDFRTSEPESGVCNIRDPSVSQKQAQRSAHTNKGLEILVTRAAFQINN